MEFQNAKPAPKGDQAAYAHTVKAPAPSLSLGGGALGVVAGLGSSIAGPRRGARVRVFVCTCRVCVCVGTCRVKYQRVNRRGGHFRSG